MEQSHYIKFINSRFSGIVVAQVEKLNDTRNPLTYLHRRFLKKDFSVSGKWDAISVANTAIMADVIAMDSSIPLKKRDTLAKASGDIPKIGMELKLNETQLTELDTIAATPGRELQLIAKLFQDTPRVITGVYERLESMFLEGLSTGLTVVDIDNTGTGVRLDFGYLNSNKFGVATTWESNPTTAKPLDDIKKVLDKASADGNVITRVLIEKSAFEALVKTDQAKQMFAFTILAFAGDKTIVPELNLVQLNQLVSQRYGFVFEVVDRSVRYEKNGVQTPVKPFAEDTLVFVTNENLGSLVYATLAEQNHPVAGVSYANADNFILVSKFRENSPSLAEVTRSQARVVPVISGVDSIYLLDSEEVQA